SSAPSRTTITPRSVKVMSSALPSGAPSNENSSTGSGPAGSMSQGPGSPVVSPSVVSLPLVVSSGPTVGSVVGPAVVSGSTGVVGADVPDGSPAVSPVLGSGSPAGSVGSASASSSRP